MDFALLTWLREFDFATYFNIITHSMELKNTLWKKEILLRDLEEGLRHIKCCINTCTQNSVWVNIIDKTSYCETHVKKPEYSGDKFVEIERIVGDFRFRLANMEKYLFFIQERNHHFAAPDIVELLCENIDGLKETNRLLEREIKEFHESVEKLKESKRLDFYFEAEDSYDQIKVTIFDIFKMISKLEEELRIDSMFKVVEELGIKYKDKEHEEETKDRKHDEEPLDIYDKKIDIFNHDYISSKKVDVLKVNILKACNLVEDYYNLNKDNEKKLEELKAKHDSLYEEYKSHLSQCEKHKSKPSHEEKKLKKHGELLKIKKLKVLDDDTIKEIKSLIEMILNKKKRTKELSSLLENVLNNIKVFDRKNHFKLMDILEAELKKLLRKDAKIILDKQELTELKECMIDFLYLLKDKHPSSDPSNEYNIDVMYRVMAFMRDHSLSPSIKLIEIYTQSETTKKLNQIPSYDVLQGIGMGKDVYDKMMKRYSSIPTPFISYFNPNLSIQTYIDCMKIDIYIGFFDDEKYNEVGVGLFINKDGYMSQGYYNENHYNDYYDRQFMTDGNIYIGGNKRPYGFHGKGEYIYADGSREVGNWVEDKKEGAFKYYDMNGTEEDRFYKKDKLIEQ